MKHIPTRVEHWWTPSSCDSASYERSWKEGDNAYDRGDLVSCRMIRSNAEKRPIYLKQKVGWNLSFDYLKERLKDALTGQLRCSSPAPTDSLHLVAWLTLALFINDSTRINPKFLSFQSFYKSLKVFPIEIKDGILFPLYSIHQAKSAKQPFKTTWDHQYCKNSTETQ